MSRRMKCFAIIAINLGVLASVASADQQINVNEFHFQDNPRVARAPDGRTVYVWDSGASGGARVRVYDAAGFALGEEGFLDVESLDDPNVAVHADGSFVVVWENQNAAMAWGQRFTAAGVHEGPRFAVNSTNGPAHRNVAVAGQPDNGLSPLGKP